MPFNLSAQTLKFMLEKLKSNSPLIKSFDHEINKAKQESLIAKSKRHFYPSLQTNISRLDAKSSLGINLNERIFESSKSKHEYLKSISKFNESKNKYAMELYQENLKLTTAYLSILKAYEQSLIHGKIWEKSQEALSLISRGRKFRFNSEYDYDIINLNLNEVELKKMRTLDTIDSNLRDLKHLTGLENIDSNKLSIPNFKQYNLSDFKKLVKKVIEEEKNHKIVEANIGIDRSKIERNAQVSVYNPVIDSNVGLQYFKNDIAEDPEWQTRWVLGVNMRYPVFASKSKSYFNKAYDHDLKSRNFLKQHVVYDISYRVITILEEIELLENLKLSILKKLDELHSLWKERDRLFFKSSLMSPAEFIGNLNSEALAKLEKVDIEYSIYIKKAELSHILDEVPN
jgi:hypothetical protein